MRFRGGPTGLLPPPVRHGALDEHGILAHGALDEHGILAYRSPDFQQISRHGHRKLFPNEKMRHEEQGRVKLALLVVLLCRGASPSAIPPEPERCAACVLCVHGRNAPRPQRRNVRKGALLNGAVCTGFCHANGAQTTGCQAQVS